MTPTIPIGKEIDLPVIAAGELVFFPHSVGSLGVLRPELATAIESLGERKMVAVLSQCQPDQQAPRLMDLHMVGTAASVLRLAEMSNGQSAKIAFVHGLQRIRVLGPVQQEPYLKVRAMPLAERAPAKEDPEFVAFMRNVRDLFHEVIEGAPNLPSELAVMIDQVKSASMLTDLVSWWLPTLTHSERQRLLETLDVRTRLHLLTEVLLREREHQQMRDKIRERVAAKIGSSQRESFLREQLDAIHEELGDAGEAVREVDDLRVRIQQAGMTQEAHTEAERELRRLASIPTASAEHPVVRNYLDWLVSLPWRTTATNAIDIERAARVLDEDHFDLLRVKERILEYLSVFQLKRDVKGPILCFVGPPGVGKTSIGQAIARAMGRSFVRLSLGGIHDEAEIRGHRRTYVGALPGQIIRSIRRAGSRDPVFMLDEIDKLGSDFRGDPASALLEVLDPEQNATFRDHYLDVAFDLSNVLFVTNANSLAPVPPALKDRMEVLELPGYADEEKREIARRYLVPKQLRENALSPTSAHFEDSGIDEIIHGYTHEAGVRGLERAIARICRKRARQIVGGTQIGILDVTPARVHELLGVPRHHRETEIAERTSVPGVATAVAWTGAGGDVLFVEAARIHRGTGQLTITGHVREVMQESAKAALSWLRGHAGDYGLDPGTFRDEDVHIHVPEGAIPKDGPSAGLAMVAALMSVSIGRCIRPRVALTGEITLSGLVLPVGGIKEKVLAAKRNGVREIVLPKRNEPHVNEEIAPHMRADLVFHYVSTIPEMLQVAFEPGLRPSSHQHQATAVHFRADGPPARGRPIHGLGDDGDR